jgi:DNA (cytosine-5)-methyltransferase 1
MSNKFVGLFSGAGGMDHGFKMAGWSPLFLTDYWQPAVKTLEKNNSDSIVKKFDIVDIDEKTVKEILSDQIDEIDAVIGGPPCQAFSRLNQNQIDTEFNINDPRRSLFMDFLRVVNYIKPKFVVMENVADIATRRLGGNDTNKNRLVVSIIKEEFEKIGYLLVYSVLNSRHYNVPQSRKRMIFIGVRKDLGLEPSLPPIEMLITSVRSEFNKIQPHHPNQEKKAVSSSLLEKLKHIPEGGYYKDLPTKMKILNEVSSDYVISYKGQDRNFCFFDGDISIEFTTILNDEKVSRVVINGVRYSTLEFLDYAQHKKIFRVMPRMGTYLRRARWDISNTITRNPIVHPEENRDLTVREKASIQTFPPDYEFFGTTLEQHVLVGNAVPCNMAEAIAKHIQKLLNLK